VYRTLRIAKYLPVHGWKLHVLTLSTDRLPKGTSIDHALLNQIPEEIQVYRALARFPIEEFNRMTGRAKKREKEKSTSANSNRPATDGKQSATGLFQSMKDRITIRWMTPDRLVGWVTPAAKLGTTVVRDHATDVIYSSGPPWSNHLVAGRIVAATGLPWVADFRDPWVGNTFRPGRSGDTWAGRKHRRLELDVYQKASLVIFNTDRARDDAVNRIGDFLAEKSVVIPNGFDPENFDNLQTNSVSSNQQTPHRSAPLQMLHTGAFYGKRNVDSLLAVIGELKHTGEITAKDLQLRLIGSVRPHEQKLIDHHSIGDIVTQTPSISHEQCLQQLVKADVLLLVQTEAPLCVPGKLYEYIAIRKPILTLAADGATADLVAKEDLGPCVDPADCSQLQDILLDLLRQHRCGEVKCSSSAIRERYDGRKQMALFNDVLCQSLSSASEMPLSNRRART